MSDVIYNISSGFFDSVNGDRLYSAADMNKPYKRVIADGIFPTPQGTPSTDFQVVAVSGMSVAVLAGNAMIGARWAENTDDVGITIAGNSSSSPRIDSIFLHIDTGMDTRAAGVVYRQGTAAGTPTAPAMVKTDNITELRLADILVAPSAAIITQANITDQRGGSDCPWVAGLIQQVDTSALFEQYRAAYAEQQQEQTEEWKTFMDHLARDYDISMSLRKHESTYTSTAAASLIPINIDGYDTTKDLLQVFINGIFAVEGTHYIVKSAAQIQLTNAISAGQKVHFVIYKAVMGGAQPIIPTDEQVQDAVDAYMDAHPGALVVDPELSDTSTHAIQNKAVTEAIENVNGRLQQHGEVLGAYTETTDNAVSNSASFWSQGGYDSSVAYKVHSESIPITQLGPLYFGGICTGTELTANSAITLRLFDSENNLLHSSGARTLTSTWARSGINLNSYPTVDHIIIDFNTNKASVHVTPETFVDNYKVYVGPTSIDSYDNFYDHTIQKYGIMEDISGLQTDVEELSAKIEANDIPDYWKSYMESKISTLQTLDGDVGNHGVGFVFITDEHWPNNAKKSPVLIEHIQKNTSVKTVVNGGDILTKHADKATALSVLCAFRNAMPEGMFSVLGNHDRNSNGTNGQDNTLWLSEDQIYGTLLKDIEEDVTFGGELYYYKDLPNQKFRMIFLNTGYDTAMGLGTAQLSWLQQRLYELQDGWTAIIFQHYVWQEAAASVETLTMGAPGTTVKNIVDGQYANMTAHGAHFAGIVCGHVHRDYSIMAENGYPIIGTTCDAGGPQAAADPVNPTRTVGTTLEQAFDVFHVDTTAKTIKLTRIGAGSDRVFTYA